VKIIYIVGAVLLFTTIHAWVKNIRLLVHSKKLYTPTDKLLNYPLLFLWLTFMTLFSLGMIINN
jgi:hypothetical protein